MATKPSFTATIPKDNPAAGHYKEGDGIVMRGRVTRVTSEGVACEIDQCEKASATKGKKMSPADYIKQRRQKS